MTSPALYKFHKRNVLEVVGEFHYYWLLHLSLLLLWHCGLFSHFKNLLGVDLRDDFKENFREHENSRQNFEIDASLKDESKNF